MRFSLNFIREFIKDDLPPDKLASLLTMSGMEVEHYERQGDDFVFDIEVTSNRYDWLSIIGIARETAACLHRKIKITSPKVIKLPLIKERQVIIENSIDCPFYVARSIRNVKITPSSQWLNERVTHCGLNAVNNVVDITNYCMLKWGNPLHAFDEDKIEGNVYIRRAKKGEIFVGIDGKERILEPENLVIADNKKVIALAGVMGAKNTEVGQNTRNIFLEAAIFSPVTVRRSRRIAGLDTDSSYRFERRVFGDYLEFASQEAANLIQQSAGGIFSGYKDAGKKPGITKKKIVISLKHLTSCLGDSFPKNKIQNILINLDFKISAVSKDKITLLPPPFRLDIKREVDVYEEFIRIYGYGRITPRIPFLAGQVKVENTYQLKNKLRWYLAQLGLKEIITYSIEADKELLRLGEENLIRITNPLREQENAMRPSLFAGMLKCIRYNLNRGQECLRFFEIANIYYRNTDNFIEVPKIGLVSAQEDDFFYLKKVVEEIGGYFNISLKLQERSIKNFTNSLMIIINNREAGFLGKLDETIKREFDLRKDLFFAQLDIALLQENKKEKQYKPFSSYPAVYRDTSIVLDKNVKFADIAQVINEKGGYIADLRIVGTYKGKDLKAGQRAFTLRIYYQSSQKTLTSEEVDSIHNTLRQTLAGNQGVSLR